MAHTASSIGRPSRVRRCAADAFGDSAPVSALPALDSALPAPVSTVVAPDSGPLEKALLAPCNAVPAPASAVLAPDIAPSQAAAAMPPVLLLPPRAAGR